MNTVARHSWLPRATNPLFMEVHRESAQREARRALDLISRNRL
jgi:hypothetical protein